MTAKFWLELILIALINTRPNMQRTEENREKEFDTESYNGYYVNYDLGFI
jgi:hypothetical protein